jgi:hypothetical protein
MMVCFPGGTTGAVRADIERGRGTINPRSTESSRSGGIVEGDRSIATVAASMNREKSDRR